MDFRTELLALADTLSAANGKSLARIGNLAGCDGGFFERLRSGKGCAADTVVRLRIWFSSNWPDEVPWPADVARVAIPDQTSEAA